MNWADRCSSSLSYIRGRRVRQNCVRVNTTHPPTPICVSISLSPVPRLYPFLTPLRISQFPSPIPNYAIPLKFSSSYAFFPLLIPHSYILITLLAITFVKACFCYFMATLICQNLKTIMSKISCVKSFGPLFPHQKAPPLPTV
jgi:hypothetical protein